jgi:hypothetical protein
MARCVSTPCRSSAAAQDSKLGAAIRDTRDAIIRTCRVSVLAQDKDEPIVALYAVSTTAGTQNFKGVAIHLPTLIEQLKELQDEMPEGTVTIDESCEPSFVEND